MAASRLVQTVQAGLSVSYQYDAAGRRTRMTWPDGFYVTFGYDALGRVSEMRENGSALIASFAYDDQGRRTQLSRGNGTTTSYAYDALGRLTRLTHDLAGTAADYDAEFTYDPLGRIVARTQANGLYHWPVTTASGTASVNGLDQLASSGGTALSYDGRGNLAGRGAWGYAHDVENQLTQVTGPVNLTLRYDALGRLERLIESGQDTRFLYDGAQVIAELDAASGAVKRRYVPGPGTNEVVAWYEGAGVGERRFIHQDERGSVVAVANGAGAAIATFRYGPWGESSDTAPGSGAGTGFSRFGYTGAIRLPGTDLLHMRARVHATALARFLEPDPVGFASGQLNLYAYVGGDPINAIDPSGLASEDCSSVKSQGCQVPKSGDPFEAARSRCGGCEEIESTPRWPFLSLDAFYDFLVSTIPFAGPQEGAGSGGGTLPGEGEGKRDGRDASKEKERRRLCAVAEVEGSFGFQAGLNASVGMRNGVGIGFSALGDAATFRLGGRITGTGRSFIGSTEFVLTQGVSGSLSIGAPRANAGISVGGSISRAVSIGGFTGRPAALALAEKPFMVSGPDPFVGFEVGGSLIFGFNIRFGLSDCSGAGG
ncbi:MAG: hypothetical protein KatS3mg119_1318 [Rhodothalassiaceae bacterium]|nr:MAG: hypothetical protein KatS3mg119_1318 [Rhodothalassiaceae bacterium]